MKISLTILHWLPRILCIIAILFISLFAADSFSPEFTFWQKISSFFIHLIPSVVMAAILIISWKKDLFGGIVFILAGLIFIPIIYSMNYKINQSVSSSLFIVAGITLPFIIVGVLFLVYYFKKQKNNKTIHNEIKK